MARRTGFSFILSGRGNLTGTGVKLQKTATSERALKDLYAVLKEAIGDKKF